MKYLKRILKLFLWVLVLPLFYVLISVLLTSITVNRDQLSSDSGKTIYLTTNGVHLDIVMAIEDVSEGLKKGLRLKDEKFLSFGWGDEDFYLNTPTWNDLTLKNAFSALFLNSSTLIHLTRYTNENSVWVSVSVSDKQLVKLNDYILNTFQLDINGNKIILEDKGYSFNDDFYKSEGSYSCINTCNSWVNSAFKESGLKCSYWTPFDFGVINKYKK